jgi:hypothetical protein
LPTERIGEDEASLSPGKGEAEGEELCNEEAAVGVGSLLLEDTATESDKEAAMASNAHKSHKAIWVRER